MAEPGITVHHAGPADLAAALAQGTQPVLLRGLVAHWPLAQAAQQSDAAVLDLLSRHCSDATVDVWLGPHEIEGRFFDHADFSGFNFSAQRLPLRAVLQRLHDTDPAGRGGSLYVGSTTLDVVLPGLQQAGNALDLAPRDPLVSLWLGTRSTVAAHQDLPDNLACVAAGRRRFTLFPPDQFANLYIGPLENTPAGRPVSMVDVRNPDLARFPRFAEALAHAEVAELEPGDAIFVPSLWWHHVEGLAAFNVLVNFWWRDCPRWLGHPEDALLHAILALRDLPPAQRDHWRALFDHHVFAADDAVTAHLPPGARGILAPLTAATAGQIKARLLRGLSR
jgi:hypothetical protein